MKLKHALAAGYRIRKIYGEGVNDQHIREDLGVIYIRYDRGANLEALSLDLDVKELPIELGMSVNFNEETAAALLVGDVAPLMQADIASHVDKRNRENTDFGSLESRMVGVAAASAQSSSRIDASLIKQLMDAQNSVPITLSDPQPFIADIKTRALFKP